MIDLGRIMTIKAIAFRSMTSITNITFDYGIKPGEALLPVEKSARNNPVKGEYLVSGTINDNIKCDIKYYNLRTQS